MDGLVCFVDFSPNASCLIRTLDTFANRRSESKNFFGEKPSKRTFMAGSFLFLILFCTTLFSQEIKKDEVYTYARKTVDTMASESMHGRGYVNDGDNIAANYMNSEFKKFGLKYFNNNFYQAFSFPINTFPGIISFSAFGFNNKPDEFNGLPGQNFLVHADAPSINKDFKSIVFDSTYANKNGLKKFKKKIKNNVSFITVDDRGVTDKSKIEIFKSVKQNYFKKEGVIEFVKKLTWEQSQNVSSFVKIQILADSFKIKEKTLGGKITIQNKFIQEHISQNVIGYIEGSEHPDSFIVFSAHYDHLGQMGKDIYFPGANDNASGCAMLLNLAKYYSLPKNKPKYSIAFIAFAAEEVGLLGSKFYTEHPLIPLNKLHFLFNMDILGTGEEGITVVNGSVFKDEFNNLVRINSANNFIANIKSRGKAAISDHYYFSENGVKTFFIYTMGGIKAYHDIYDKAETLPLNEFENLFKLITRFGDYLQE